MWPYIEYYSMVNGIGCEVLAWSRSGETYEDNCNLGSHCSEFSDGLTDRQSETRLCLGDEKLSGGVEREEGC